MAEFKNKFDWSISRQRNFDKCKRLYYYNHYGMWNGWDIYAPEEARLCYRLSKMTNLQILAGSVVHPMIHELLESVKSPKLMRLDSLKTRARDKLNGAWKQSKDKLWLESPKWNINLFEHYYNRKPSKEYLERIKTKVMTCLTNFYNSEIFLNIQEVDTINWKPIEEFQELQIENCRVGLKMDFAIEIDGNLEIYDWKTGKEDESNIEQLVCYALYGEQAWGYTLDNIILNIFYLNENQIEEHKVSAEQKGEAVDRIIQNSERMLGMLEDKDNNIASKDNFPMIDNLNECKWCFFQEMCYGGSLE